MDDRLLAMPRADGSLTLSRCELEAGRTYRIEGGYGRTAGTLTLYTQNGVKLAQSSDGTLDLNTSAVRDLIAHRQMGWRAPCVAWYDDGAAYRCAIDLRAAPLPEA